MKTNLFKLTLAAILSSVTSWSCTTVDAWDEYDAGVSEIGEERSALRGELAVPAGATRVAGGLVQGAVDVSDEFTKIPGDLEGIFGGKELCIEDTSTEKSVDVPERSLNDGAQWKDCGGDYKRVDDVMACLDGAEIVVDFDHTDWLEYDHTHCLPGEVQDAGNCYLCPGRKFKIPGPFGKSITINLACPYEGDGRCRCEDGDLGIDFEFNATVHDQQCSLPPANMDGRKLAVDPDHATVEDGKCLGKYYRKTALPKTVYGCKLPQTDPTDPVLYGELVIEGTKATCRIAGGKMTAKEETTAISPVCPDGSAPWMGPGGIPTCAGGKQLSCKSVVDAFPRDGKQLYCEGPEDRGFKSPCCLESVDFGGQVEGSELRCWAKFGELKDVYYEPYQLDPGAVSVPL